MNRKRHVDFSFREIDAISPRIAEAYDEHTLANEGLRAAPRLKNRVGIPEFGVCVFKLSAGVEAGRHVESAVA